ncbi:MAG: endonuclease III [Lachnospiraceae bacterium]|jgi:endonuclease-3|nr:endonuclease III [Lachnospiraceae bacterium]
MKKTDRTRTILALLDEHYGTDIKCFLHHENAWQLLVATILSAQCTDDRVNLVTRELFAKYDSVVTLAGADVAELEDIIRSTGFFRNKAKNIIACCQRIRDVHGGEVPRTVEELTALSGVGRKTANVVRGNVFGEPSIVVDTHVMRVSKRLGVTEESDPVKIEFDLMKVLPEEHWIRYNMQVISFGRAICKAPKPKCGECFLREYCSGG